MLSVFILYNIKKSERKSSSVSHFTHLPTGHFFIYTGKPYYSMKINGVVHNVLLHKTTYTYFSIEKWQMFGISEMLF